MPGTTRLTGTATTQHIRKRTVSLMGSALLCAALSACATDGEAPAPVVPAPGTPGALRFETCARPVYPAHEFKQNHQGTVTLRFLLSAYGTVKQSQVAKSSGYPALDEAARLALMKCTFTAPLVNGEPGEAWTHVQYVWQQK